MSQVEANKTLKTLKDKNHKTDLIIHREQIRKEYLFLKLVKHPLLQEIAVEDIKMLSDEIEGGLSNLDHAMTKGEIRNVMTDKIANDRCTASNLYVKHFIK